MGGCGRGNFAGRAGKTRDEIARVRCRSRRRDRAVEYSSDRVKPVGEAGGPNALDGRWTRRRTLVDVSDLARNSDDAPKGTSLLPRPLTDNELAAAPVLASADALLIDDLTDDEDDAFAAALAS